MLYEHSVHIGTGLNERSVAYDLCNVTRPSECLLECQQVFTQGSPLHVMGIFRHKHIWRLSQQTVYMQLHIYELD